MAVNTRCKPRNGSAPANGLPRGIDIDAASAAAAPATATLASGPAASSAVVTPLRRPSATRALDGLLHVLTCGSVDDGKSTLIGRLLWDASDLPDDTRANVLRQAATAGGTPDYSLLVDGLVAEREQGITIDIAWRYFDSDTRRIVIIDSPGHEQYTRNMASGASHADVAIMLVDARSGIKRQTRRHAAILNLAGVRHVVLAVNKMDLVGWSEASFLSIAADFAKLTTEFSFTGAVAIPVSAVGGDNIASRSTRATWYAGPTLLEHLESLPARGTSAVGPFRMPVQTVLRDGQDFRGLAGTITSGRICVGDRVVDVLSGQQSRVLRIATMDRDLDIASAGQAVAVQLEHDLDIARGAVLSGPSKAPVAATRVDARLVWLSETPFDAKASYLLRTATDIVAVSKINIAGLLDLDSMETRGAAYCAANDIADVEIRLSRPVAVDHFAGSAGVGSGTGTVMLVDALTGASVAGGVVRATHAAAADSNRTETPLAQAPSAPPANADTSPSGHPPASRPVILSRAALASGLNADLDDTPAGRVEFARRTLEVVKLFAEAGVRVELVD